jgi:methylthioribulose 1-phosphate dehydratase/enolase-phosphatase E1
MPVRNFILTEIDIFFNLYFKGAVLHSHAICTNLITSILEGQSEFTISHQEMIKGIDGHGFFDTLTIPIIENTAWEHELADSLGEAIAKYPKAPAVLVRRHGMYVWGNTWQQAKRHGECMHYLLDIAISMHKLGMDINTPVAPVGSKRRLFSPVAPLSSAGPRFKHVILDIEGTTTPITFVKETLFPYAFDHAKDYLAANWDSAVIQTIVKDLISQALADGLSILDFVAEEKEQCIARIASFVQASIKEDRKIGPLKKLQGLIWEEAYASGELKGAVYEDVPRNLDRLIQNGSSVSIYSSGSKQAQQLLFRHSTQGDLRPKLSCYFDTKVGLKQEADSYREILLTLGVERASEVLFVTDILAEAVAASEAGYQVLISVRPGNAPITESHTFKTITSFDEI